MTDDFESEEFEQIASKYFEALYRFALSLTRAEADASDLTQQTFYIWATKRCQLRDRSKAKAWLFTTLHREFLRMRKRSTKFPHFELDDPTAELPSIPPESANRIDAAQLVNLLDAIPEAYRGAITLFYLEDCSYKEIAEILDIPIGTVRSRISRGIVQLQKMVGESTRSQQESCNGKCDSIVLEKRPGSNFASDLLLDEGAAVPFPC